MEIISTVKQDGDEWCIEVLVRTQITLHPGVVRRRAEKITRLCGYKTEPEARQDEAEVRARATRNKAFW
jgi:hypothetical protein